MIVNLKTDTEMEICRFADELESAGIAFSGLDLDTDGYWCVNVSEANKPKVQQLIQIHHTSVRETDQEDACNVRAEIAAWRY